MEDHLSQGYSGEDLVIKVLYAIAFILSTFQGDRICRLKTYRDRFSQSTLFRRSLLWHRHSSMNSV
ncbi:MAG: hypothetical protein HC852_15315 [Acaryochloridaceae cyanobacterium RU_4_10]|nr:hypothetical protein [Acaryochloridaceae cyanobacterium RU_4_10]